MPRADDGRAGADRRPGNSELAACCAGELASASFKKVSRPQSGASVTVKF